MHEPIHAAAEAMRELFDGIFFVVLGDGPALQLCVFVAVLVLVLFLPDEVPASISDK